MAEKSKKYPHAFFERNSWYHRTKVLQEDYSVKYGKIGGFKTDKEAEDAYNKHMEEFDRTMKVKLLPQGKDITVKEYLVYWYESIFSERIESTTGYVSAYVLYSFLLPSIDDDMKLRLINVEYINAVLKAAAKYCESAGNKSRELLFIAFKDAVVERMIPNNPVIGTKKYPRKKANVMILNKEQTKRFLLAAKARNWFLEIILALYLGLRKGDDDDKIRLNQRKPSKYKGLRRFGPEKNLQRINKFMKERPIFYKNLIQMKENIRFYLRCFYCITKVMILQFNSENRTELARNG